MCSNFDNSIPLCYTDLVKFLKDKGLIINDISKAKIYLLTIGYSRLKRYFSVFYDNERKFINNFSFEDLLSIYTFDRKLRNLFMEASERIEIAVKSVIINLISVDRKDSYFVYDERVFNNIENYNKFLKRIKQIIFSQTGKDVFDKDLQCWEIIDNITFGNLNFLYSNLIPKYREDVANMFKLNNRVMYSWLLSIRTARNVCAHYSLLWSRIFGTEPINFKDKKTKETVIDFGNNKKKLFPQFFILSYFMKKISPNTTWVDRVLKLIEEYQFRTTFITKDVMGFPEDYREMLNKIDWIDI